MMNEKDVTALLKKIQEIGIEVWIDGGWAVDAVLGRQTREHNDIDIFIQKKDKEKILNLLVSNGYSEVKVDFTTEDHSAWFDKENHYIDLHFFEFIGENLLSFNNESYPSEIISGKGRIGGMSVRCLTVEAQLLYHQGYEHKEKDIHDVKLLCEAFGLPIPKQYQG